MPHARRFLFCLAVLMVVATFVVQPAGLAQSSDAKVVADGKDVIGLLDQGKFADVAGRFNAQMGQLLSADQLAQTWKGLQGQAGAFKGISDGTAAKAQGLDVAILTCNFEKVALLASVAFDAEKKIAGLRFVPKP